jgi:hypothetical protein
MSDAAADAETRIASLERTIRIMELALPLEEELSDRISEMLKYLAMGDGFTVAGVARLLVDCQKRMAADWLAIGQLRREVKR